MLRLGCDSGLGPPTSLAGIPTAVQFSGMSLSTTEPAPIFEFAPTLRLPRIVTPAPMTTHPHSKKLCILLVLNCYLLL